MSACPPVRAMSAVHRERFTVRHYECDAFGDLARVTYVRWMQETAFRASAALGYGTARYAELGCLWLIRDTDIEFLGSLPYGADVEVRTWVADLRRTHSVRSYEFALVATGELVARASTDWAMVDDRTLSPTAVPDEMMAAFWTDGPPAPADPRERLPRADFRAPADAIVRLGVAWRDIDAMWHVNNAVYVEYVEHAAAAVCADRGWPLRRMHENGLRMTACRHRIEYRLPARAADDLGIAVWWSASPEPDVWRFEIRRETDRAVLARARTAWQWQDLASGARASMPAGLSAALRRAAPVPERGTPQGDAGATRR